MIMIDSVVSDYINVFNATTRISFAILRFVITTSAGERKSSYHPLVQLLLGHHSVPRNPIFWKNRISWWYGNLCFPALAPKGRIIKARGNAPGLIKATENSGELFGI
ncbi:MAG: hypothetical protein DRR08_28545 [Candidatus Parabeggiatoa sp. nov. 2]|nr:MAG: hypothetical protein B6247_02625 [Beggiatoa sp. 4572_84]RKZ52190.1 MAG: hypothetical protein DRR08_28545 [Gammaproteobacteria bacterium]